MHLIYNISIQLYLLAIKVAALFNPKAKQWLQGRKNLFEELQQSITDEDEIIWFHVASLGEFEQGRPLMEKVKESFPGHKILLTFFSPSGYEVKKSYEGADYIFYLPMDTQSNARKFVSIVKPKMVIFVKYEFWFNYINELYINKIPLLMISVIFRPSQHFFQFWGRWFRKQLSKITWFYVQNKQSIYLLKNINIYHADKSGDTRFDRVKALANEQHNTPAVERFKGKNLLMVAGSSWPPDEDILKYVLEKSAKPFKLIVAPHVVNNSHVSELQQKFAPWNPILFTDFDSSFSKESAVLILNTTGILSQIYRYADISYVGGGFGAGIHNLLEPATYGQPVLFGPNFKKFQEAHDLIDIKAGYPISNKEETLKTIDLLLGDDALRAGIGNKAKKYVTDNAGATDIVLNKIKEFIVEPSTVNKL